MDFQSANAGRKNKSPPNVPAWQSFSHSLDAASFIGGVGPVIQLGKGKFPVTLEIGGSATYLGRYHFGKTDFGDHWQFTSHIGLQWEITKHFGLDWRVQHMSNAGLADPNGGLNMQMGSVFYKF